MNKTLTPARVISPGRILQRELDARGLTQKDLAKIMNRPAQTINEIIKGTKQITPETARELSAALGTTAEFWTNLEANYRLQIVKKKQKESEIKRRSRLYTLAPISELQKRGWIASSNSLDELETSVCQLLGIKAPQETPQLSVNFRNSQLLESEYNAKIAWCKRVEQIVSKRKISKFQLEEFEAELPLILDYAQKLEDIAKIPRFLNNLGVHFLIVPHLKKTALDGAAFYYQGNPVVALTLRHNRIDCFWFSLMHELGHIFAGHKGVYLDNLEQLEEHIEEIEADKLACNWLINEQELSSFANRVKPKFSKRAIIDFAQTQNRHPGLIVGRLQHEGIIPYQNLRQLLVKVKPILSTWIEK